MHVESVAWISERKDVLYTAFYLLSTFAYLRYIEAGRTTGKYIGTLLLFVGALLSKSAAVTLPVLFVVIDIYKGRGINKKTLIEKIPFLLLSILFGIINILAQRAGGPVNILCAYYGTINGIFLFTSGIALYLIRAVVPFDLSAMHYFPNVLVTGLPWTYYLSLPFLAIITWLILRLKKDNPMRREIIFGTLFFLVTISVMLQLISVGSALTAERYTYVPFIGLFYIAGQWLANLATGKQFKAIAVGAFSFAAIVFSIQTYNRIGVWKDDETLLTDVIDKNPGILDVNYIYLLRGDSRIYTRDFRGALEDFTQALSITPQFAFAGSAYFGRAHVYEELGDLKAALGDYNSTIRVNPKLVEAYNGRGWLYFRSGDTRSAMQDYNEALSLNPRYAEAYNNRGWAYNNTGDLKAAIQDYNKAISIEPAFGKPYFNRAAVNAYLKNYAAAMDDYNCLVKLKNDDYMAYYFRGIARMNLSDRTGACQDWKRSAELGYTKASEMIQQYCH
jgi:tetratricopeptide (TPR) repeat protein